MRVALQLRSFIEATASKDLHALSQTSRQFRAEIDDPWIWRLKFAQFVGVPARELGPPPPRYRAVTYYRRLCAGADRLRKDGFEPASSLGAKQVALLLNYVAIQQPNAQRHLVNFGRYLSKAPNDARFFQRIYLAHHQAYWTEVRCVGQWYLPLFALGSSVAIWQQDVFRIAAACCVLFVGGPVLAYLVARQTRQLEQVPPSLAAAQHAIDFFPSLYATFDLPNILAFAQRAAAEPRQSFRHVYFSEN